MTKKEFEKRFRCDDFDQLEEALFESIWEGFNSGSFSWDSFEGTVLRIFEQRKAFARELGNEEAAAMD